MRNLKHRIIPFIQLTSGIVGFAALAIGLIFVVLESYIDSERLRVVSYTLAEPLSQWGMAALCVFAVCFLVNRPRSTDPN